MYNTVTLDGNLYYTNQLNCEILNGTSYHYTYDDVGNIIAIKKGTGYGSTTSDYKAYSYDNKYQLTGETMGSTVNSWSYDALGNILSKTTSVNGATINTVTYGYGVDTDCGWENLLTNITIKNYTDNTEITETIDYDAIGNPVVYRGANLSWYGRQLTDYSKGGVNANFTYDAEGLRSTKTVNGVKTTYQYIGDQLLYEDRGNGTKLYYFYDSNGILSAIYHHVNGVKTAYHVQTNYQGDVVALYDWSGSLVAKYDYDAWGNILSVTDANGAPITSSTHIANVNPFRYRSYYYDNDLGLYYLQSRYYDSTIGRFVNADTYLPTVAKKLIGYNTFAYCYNNSVNLCDKTGFDPDYTDAMDRDDTYVSIFEIIIIIFGLNLLFSSPYTSATPEVLIPEIELPKFEFSKKSKTSGKERANNKPSWVNKGMIDKGKSAEENAWRILNDKYGRGNWNKGPDSEFNKIKKWLTRDCGLSCLAATDDDIYIMDGHLIIYDNSGRGFGWFDGYYLEFYD